MHNDFKFRLPDPYDPQWLFSALGDHYAILKEQPVRKSMAIYDTFDWRLFNRSLVLYTCESNLLLRNLFKNRNIHSTPIATPPVFIGDFPDCKMKDHLSTVIKMRALIKHAELHSRSTAIRMLNRDEKTVARLVYEEFRAEPSENAPVLTTCMWLRPVRGYPKARRNLVNILEEAGCAVLKKEDIYFKAIEAAGKHPGSYSSKFNIQLDPALHADEAAKIILRDLLQIMKINEANLEKDLDTEVLHDFRVSIRRTRSALVLMKSVFAQIVTDRFKKDFAFVGKLTNQLRDLDVYLLNADAFKAMLPPVLRDDIDPLFDYLRKNRSTALQAVIRGIQSKRYKHIMQDWEAFLDEPVQDRPLAHNAHVPIVVFARKKNL